MSERKRRAEEQLTALLQDNARIQHMLLEAEEVL